MSSTINTYTTNWFRVKYPDEIEEHIERMNKDAECFESGDIFTVHHHKGQIRLTAFDVIEQSFGYYEEEAEEGWVDLEEEIASALEEGEVLRLTSLSWFKGRLESMSVSVSTWDGRRENRSFKTWNEEMSQSLNIDKKLLRGWN